MAEVNWTEPAIEDVSALAEYISLDNPEAATRLAKKIFTRVELLSHHPELGAPIPELLPATRFRQLIEAPCRIFYRYDRKRRKVFILGVIRGERLFQKCLLWRQGQG